MGVDQIIKNLTQYSVLQKKSLLENAKRALKINPENKEAQKLFAQFRQKEDLKTPRVMSNGVIEWEKHGHARKSRGFVGNVLVAKIFKGKTHTQNNDGIYHVEVDSAALSSSFRYIEDAREAAEVAYSQIEE